MSTLERKRNSLGQHSHRNGSQTGVGVGGQTGSRKSKRNCWCCRKVFSLMCSNIGLFALVIIYSYLGAYIFRHYEAPHERSVTSDVIALRNSTIKNLWNITDKYNILYKKNWTLMVTLEIEKFQNEIIKAVRDGFDGKATADGKPHQWSISSAFLYSLTVITTIGYGNIAPKTNEGKMATIVYALIGIPLMLMFLANTGYFFANCFRYVYRQCCGCSSTNGQHDNNSAMHAQVDGSTSLTSADNMHGYHAHCRHHHNYHACHIALNEVGQNQGNVLLHCNSNPQYNSGKQRDYNAVNTVCNQYGTLPNTGTCIGGCDVDGKLCSGGCMVNDHTCTGTLTRSGHTHSTPHSTLLRNEHRHHHNDHINSDVTGVQLCLPNNTSVHDYHSQQQQLQQQQQVHHQQPDKHSRRKKLAVPVILCLLLICGYIVFGAAIISVLEGWTILDGSYFCFLALSTIGFGGLNADSTLFAKTANYERKLIFLCGYVLTGMALIAMCFTLIQDQIVFRLKRCKRNFGVKDEDIYDEDDETIAALQNTAQLVENTEDFDV